MTTPDRLDVPTTEAGLRLVAKSAGRHGADCGVWWNPSRGCNCGLLHIILAIEDEARASLVAENKALREAAADLLALPPNHRSSVPLNGIDYDPKSGEGVIRRLRAALHREDGT